MSLGDQTKAGAPKPCGKVNNRTSDYLIADDDAIVMLMFCKGPTLSHGNRNGAKDWKLLYGLFKASLLKYYLCFLLSLCKNGRLITSVVYCLFAQTTIAGF